MKISQDYSLFIRIGAIAVSLFFPLATIESAQALVFVENLSEPLANNGGLTMSSSFILGSSFTTDNNSYSLSSVTASLEEQVESVFSINLHTDNVGEPGVIIGQLNTTENILSQASLNNYLFTPSSSINLDANTTYWLLSSIVDTVNPGFYGWGYTNSANETSPGAWTIGNDLTYSDNGGSSWNSAPDLALQFNVDADIASAAVPFEFSPAMGILFIGGLFGIKTAYGKYQVSKVELEN